MVLSSASKGTNEISWTSLKPPLQTMMGKRIPVTSRHNRAFHLGNHSIDETEDNRRLTVVVVGAGISGILAGVLLPAKVPNISLRILEKNSDVVR